MPTGRAAKLYLAEPARVSLTFRGDRRLTHQPALIGHKRYSEESTAKVTHIFEIYSKRRVKNDKTQLLYRIIVMAKEEQAL